MRILAPGPAHIARAEAKRLLAVCTEQEVVLDMSRVISIGQGFADEIARCWLLANPERRLTLQACSHQVLAMLSHVLQRTDLPQAGDRLKLYSRDRQLQPPHHIEPPG